MTDIYIPPDMMFSLDDVLHADNYIYLSSSHTIAQILRRVSRAWTYMVALVCIQYADIMKVLMQRI